MSLEAAKAFRDKVNNDEELQQLLLDARIHFNTTGEQKLDAFELAQARGFEFTREEYHQAFDRIEQEELSDFELELVSAGGLEGCEEPYCPGPS